MIRILWELSHPVGCWSFSSCRGRGGLRLSANPFCIRQKFFRICCLPSLSSQSLCTRVGDHSTARTTSLPSLLSCCLPICSVGSSLFAWNPHLLTTWIGLLRGQWVLRVWASILGWDTSLTFIYLLGIPTILAAVRLSISEGAMLVLVWVVTYLFLGYKSWPLT